MKSAALEAPDRTHLCPLLRHDDLEGRESPSLRDFSLTNLKANVETLGYSRFSLPDKDRLRALKLTLEVLSAPLVKR